MNEANPLKLGLKVWSKNRNYLDEAKRLVAENICNYIELYAFPGTFEEYAPLWKTIDAPYVIHAPHFMQGMNLADVECRNSNRRLVDEAFRFADYLDAEHLIFHPGVGGSDKETIRQLNTWPNDRLKRILIENKPYRSINEPPLICNGHSPEAIQRIMYETGVGFCFDIGHGICSSNSRKADPWADLTAFERFGPEMYHLSDNDFRSEIDGHLNFGNGNYDFNKIIGAIDVSKPISLETEKCFPDSLCDFADGTLFLKNRLYDFSFRLASLDDMKDVFELANDPVVRSCSIQNGPIQWETHRIWFSKKIADPGSYFWVIHDSTGKLAGYIRYDLDSLSERRICSIAFSPEIRGRGLGTFALKKTFQLLRREAPETIEAWVQETNRPSIRIFEKSGYRKTDEQIRDGIDYFIFQK